MPANFAHYEDLSQLEDDVVGFLPTVAEVEVFGCEIDLLMPDTKLPLRDPILSTLLKQNRFQVIVRPCIEEGHSVWQFQNAIGKDIPRQSEFQLTLGRRRRTGPSTLRPCFAMSR